MDELALLYGFEQKLHHLLCSLGDYRAGAEYGACTVLVEELVEHVVDRFADRHAAIGQLAVDPVGHGFEELALSLVQRVEQRDQMGEEVVVDESLPKIVVDLRREHDSDEEFVHQREMRPFGIREHLVPVIVLRRGMNQLLSQAPHSLSTFEAFGSARNKFVLIMLIVS